MSEKHKDIMPWRQFLQLIGVLIICGFAIVAGSKLAHRAIPDKPEAPLVIIHKIEK